jgi:hypothetical protein
MGGHVLGGRGVEHRQALVDKLLQLADAGGRGRRR